MTDENTYGFLPPENVDRQKLEELKNAVSELLDIKRRRVRAEKLMLRNMHTLDNLDQYRFPTTEEALNAAIDSLDNLIQGS